MCLLATLDDDSDACMLVFLFNWVSACTVQYMPINYNLYFRVHTGHTYRLRDTVFLNGVSSYLILSYHTYISVSVLVVASIHPRTSYLSYSVDRIRFSVVPLVDVFN